MNTTLDKSLEDYITNKELFKKKKPLFIPKFKSKRADRKAKKKEIQPTKTEEEIVSIEALQKISYSSNLNKETPQSKEELFGKSNIDKEIVSLKEVAGNIQNKEDESMVVSEIDPKVNDQQTRNSIEKKITTRKKKRKYYDASLVIKTGKRKRFKKKTFPEKSQIKHNSKKHKLVVKEEVKKQHKIRSYSNLDENVLKKELRENQKKFLKDKESNKSSSLKRLHKVPDEQDTSLSGFGKTSFELD